jgi:predicted nucleic acid-binding Zn ribbon protein
MDDPLFHPPPAAAAATVAAPPQHQPLDDSTSTLTTSAATVTATAKDNIMIHKQKKQVTTQAHDVPAAQNKAATSFPSPHQQPSHRPPAIDTSTSAVGDGDGATMTGGCDDDRDNITESVSRSTSASPSKNKLNSSPSNNSPPSDRIGSKCDAIRHLPRTVQWKIQWNLLQLPTNSTECEEETKVKDLNNHMIDEHTLAHTNAHRIREQQTRVEFLLERHLWNNSPFRDSDDQQEQQTKNSTSKRSSTTGTTNEEKHDVLSSSNAVMCEKSTTQDQNSNSNTTTNNNTDTAILGDANDDSRSNKNHNNHKKQTTTQKKKATKDTNTSIDGDTDEEEGEKGLQVGFPAAISKSIKRERRSSAEAAAVIQVVDDPLSAFAQSSCDSSSEGDDDNDNHTNTNKNNEAGGGKSKSKQHRSHKSHKQSKSQVSSQWQEFYTNREMIDLIYKDLKRLPPRLVFWDYDREGTIDPHWSDLGLVPRRRTTPAVAVVVVVADSATQVSEIWRATSSHNSNNSNSGIILPVKVLVRDHSTTIMLV